MRLSHCELLAQEVGRSNPSGWRSASGKPLQDWNSKTSCLGSLGTLGWEAPFYAKTYAKRGIVMGGLDESLRLPRLISNGMILQREQPIKIWGWAKPGTAVTVKFLEREHTALAGVDGAWAVVLPSAQAGGPIPWKFAPKGRFR